jgi:phosphoglucomutase
MMAVTGKDPAAIYGEIEKRFGQSFYARIDAAASTEQRMALKRLSPAMITVKELAGEPILAAFTRAPGNDADIGGIKITTANGWFAARPSGTEDINKIYAESFLGESHLQRIVNDAMSIVNDLFTAAGLPRTPGVC